MSSRLIEPSPFHAPRLARIDVGQYRRMLETGILHDGDPIELLDGLLVYKDRSALGEDPMTVGERHAIAIGLLMDLGILLQRLGCHIRCQLPITLPPHHEPEPDGAIVRGRRRDYARRHPGAEDVLCLFEVAESSLRQDRTEKAELYAAAGIGQYVIVNLVDNRLEVHTQPRARRGRYARTAHLKPGASLALNLGEGMRVEIEVRDLLP